MSGEDNEVSLRVAKAIPSDVGHGRARISGEHGLDLKPGDIVEIKGEKRSTAAIYWRSRPEDSKMDIVRIDGIIRKNAGVSLGDRVTIVPRLRQKNAPSSRFPQLWPTSRRSSLALESKALHDEAFPSAQSWQATESSFQE